MFNGTRCRVPADKLPGFNVLRFVLAMWVALVHYNQLPESLEITYAFTSLPNFRYLSWFYLHMVDPVPIFWSVSGFVFFVAYPETRAFSVKRFLVARFARLYPLHWTTLLAMVFVSAIQSVLFQTVHFNESLYVFLAHFLLVQNWFFYLDDAFNSPSWSISVELMTYLVYMLYKIHPYRFFYVLIIALSGILFLTTNPSSHLSPFLSIFLFFFSHLIASLCINRSLFVNLVVIAMLSVMVFAFVAFLPNFAVLFRAPLIALSVTLIFKLIEKLPDPAWLGDITYSTYLWHVPLMSLIAIAMRFFRVNPDVTLTVPFQIFFFTMLCFVGGLSFRFLEQPLRTKINSFSLSKHSSAE